MSEKKPGFFQRLFGGNQPEPPPAPEETVPETPVTPDAIPDVPEPEAKPPAPTEPTDAPPAPEHDLPPGPPETTPDYIEDVEDDLAAAPLAVGEPEQPKGWFARLASGLKRSSDNLTSSITSVFTKRKLDAATLDELEDVLIQADLGIDTAIAITETLRRDRFDKDVSGEDVRAVLATEVEQVLTPVAQPLLIDRSKKPFIILMIGVNGSGKTTTIGKLTKKFQNEGKSVMLAAGDTFRAAAVEQLQVWGERNNVPVVAQHTGADSASVIFDAIQSAKSRGVDVVIADTAGRLQNKDNLMQELEKVVRVMKKLDESAPHEVMLVLDAGTGQNALSQAQVFQQAVGVSGITLTKLDGTAKGGIVFAIARQLQLPIRFIGVGEQVDDLRSFDAETFVDALFDE